MFDACRQRFCYSSNLIVHFGVLGSGCRKEVPSQSLFYMQLLPHIPCSLWNKCSITLWMGRLSNFCFLILTRNDINRLKYCMTAIEEY